MEWDSVDARRSWYWSGNPSDRVWKPKPKGKVFSKVALKARLLASSHSVKNWVLSDGVMWQKVNSNKTAV